MLPLRLPVVEISQIAEVRRRASLFAGEQGFGEQDRGRLELVATELASNLVKHTVEGGEFLIWPDPLDPGALFILTLDSGAGIRNVSQAISDGYSTAGSPGTGLGAVRRLSSELDIYSHAAGGTAVLAKFLSSRRAAVQRTQAMDVGAVRLPMPNESECGDAWAVGQDGDRWLGMVVDGLGHGVFASEVAEQAVRTFRKSLHLPPEQILEAVHLSLRSTRGGVGAIAEVNAGAGSVRFVGVGNISAVLHSSSGQRNMVSQNGTLGQEVRKLSSFSYPWNSESVLVMHSDGLSNRWDLRNYPGLACKPPVLIAGVLFRDFSRQRDDVSVLVAREGRS